MGKQKQKYIEGMEPPSIPELDEAMDKYVGIRDGRMEQTRAEVDAREELTKLLKKHGLERYEAQGLIAELTHEDKVKVRRAKEEQDPDAE